MSGLGREHMRGASRELTEAARGLRQRMTPAEQLLWNVLRDRELDDLKFRRQLPLGGHIFDFYFSEYRLLIELDGAIHGDPEQAVYDQHRSDQLPVYGYTVLRFQNEQVFTNI
ncbi:MAG TPA: DUF559 domain-containing protein, partial [Thermomicrobiales bacterium]|nr:DUF559 domain-containing protein [Thermomicrobiales bacterium]